MQDSLEEKPACRAAHGPVQTLKQGMSLLSDHFGENGEKLNKTSLQERVHTHNRET